MEPDSRGGSLAFAAKDGELRRVDVAPTRLKLHADPLKLDADHVQT